MHVAAKVSTILATKGTGVISIPADATIATAITVLKEHHIGAIVVSNDGVKIAGILSERDIVQALDSHGPGLLNDKISDIMTRLVVTCSPESTVDEVMQIMTNGRFRHIPVIDEGKLVGVVSIGDLVKSRLEELKDETEALRNYIATG